MAAPSYTEDLNDLNDADADTDWAEFTGNSYNAQGAFAADNAYQFIQGNTAITQICTKDASVGSLGYNNGAGTGGHGTDGAYFVWQTYGTNSNLGTYAQGGFRIVVGSSLAAFYAWYVGGVDKAPYPYGGWTCNVANTTITPDDTAGAPGAAEQYIGGAIYVTTGSNKGSPHGVDAIRYGRGSAIFENGDLGNGYATISGFATLNDNINNRWGLIQETSGGYLWQGRMLLGTDANPVDFRDTNKNIFIKWTPKVTDNFNLIEIQNIASNIEMTGFTFQVLDIDTASFGRLLMSDPADVAIDQCTFIDMDTFIFDTTTGVNTVEITNTTFRRCGEITQGGATFDSCSILNIDSTSSIQADNIDVITNCIFQSDGLNHAIELDFNHAGGTYNLTGCTFTGYASIDGSTGNEAIYNNSGGAVTIYIVDGLIPSVRNEVGSSTTVILAIDWYFEIQNTEGTVVTNAEFRIYDSNDNELYGVETSDGTEKYTFSGTLSGNLARIVVLSLDYLYFTQTLTHPSASNSASAPVVLSLSIDRVYDNS